MRRLKRRAAQALLELGGRNSLNLARYLSQGLAAEYRPWYKARLL
jgi:hypothetical protein